MAIRLSDVDALARRIAEMIRKSKCLPNEIVDALLAVAAGRAVHSKTHADCNAFERHAHEAYHSAYGMFVDRERRSTLVN